MFFPRLLTKNHPVLPRGIVAGAAPRYQSLAASRDSEFLATVGQNPSQVAFCPARRAVLVEHSICRAILRQDTPCARSRPILTASTIFSGRPKRFPFARALRRPALTRSTIRLRSSSATAPRTVKTISPVGVDVWTLVLVEPVSPSVVWIF